MFNGTGHSRGPGRPGWRRIAGVALTGAALLAGHAFAADKSGVSLQSVTLPDGPGSIRGLGNEFDPDLPNGTANFSVPLPVMRGTNDLAPELVLDYDAGSENGIMGFGWDLGIPFVARRDERPLPRYGDTDAPVDAYLAGIAPPLQAEDRFVSDEHSAPEGLVRREDGYFFGELEGVFVRYERTDDHWTGTYPDGTRLIFGASAEARVQDGAGRIFQWNLEEQRDTFGNTVRYVYETFPGAENLHQSYLVRIEYGAGPPPWDHFHMVVFTYEDRPDWFETGRPGFFVRTGKRLARIEMATQGVELAGHESGDYNGDGVTAWLNRRYDLTYEADAHWSLLTTITEYGADGVTALPTLTMEYTRCSDAATVSALDHYIGTENAPAVLFDKDYVEITDLNGDGLPDLLRTHPGGGLHTAYLNLGETAADGASTVAFSDGILMGGDNRTYPVNLSEDAGAPAYLADMNGNGRSDLVYSATPFETYYFTSEIVDGKPEWGTRRSMNPFFDRAMPPSPFDGENTEHGDLNGDDLNDVFQSISVGGKTAIRVWLNEGGDRFAQPYTVAQDFSFQLGGEGVEVADLNGDGLLDLVLVKDGALQVAAGLGYGRFGPPVSIPMPELLGLPGEISFEDINGDGLDDLVQLWPQPGVMRYFLNLGNYTFSEARVITDIPARLSSEAAVRVADLNGNGSADLLYADLLAEPRLQAVDLGACLGCLPGPNLLKRVDNGIGRIMHYRYDTTTSYLLADRAAGTPWPDPLPYPVQVVAEVLVEDTLGNVYNTLYSYHDGVYNTDYRMFVGFAGVATFDEGDEVAPTRVDRYTFDVGRDLFLLRGNQLRVSAETVDGDVYYVERSEYASPEVFTGVDGTVVRQVYESLNERQFIEKGAGTPRTVRTERLHDAYGNETELREWGVYDEDDPLAFHDERFTKVDYAINEAAWIVRHPSRIRIFDGEDTLLTRSDLFYDDETFSGENFGEVTRGAQTLERGYYDLDDPEGFVDSDRTQYDAYGNAILMMDELAEAPDGVVDEDGGHFRTIAYDEYFRTFPEHEEIAVGGGNAPLTVRAAYDYGLGTVLESVDFAGHSTRYGHDAFGRLAHTYRPEDEDGFPSLEYIYAQGVPYNGGQINYIETRLLVDFPGDQGSERLDHYAISRSYVDGMGRKLGEWALVEPNPRTGAVRASVTEAAGFHSRGGIAFELVPHFVERPGADLDEALAFEHFEAPGWSGVFQTEDGLEAYGFDDAPRVATRYDAILRTIRVDHPDGTWREQRHEPLIVLHYDENATDPSSEFFGVAKVHHSDGLGRLIRVDERVLTDREGNPLDELDTWTTEYVYRADGPLLRMTDALGNVRRYEYDALQTLYFVDDPNRGHRHLDVDDYGNILGVEDAAGRVTRFTYDGVNRLLTVDYQDDGEDFSFGFTYDPDEPLSDTNRPDVYYVYDTPFGTLDDGAGNGITAENTAGQLAYAVYPTGAYHYSYTPRGGEGWVLHQMLDLPFDGFEHFLSQRRNDPAGRPVWMSYPDGDEVRIAYTRQGKIAEVGGGAALNANGADYFLRGLEYGPGELRLEARYGNGLHTRYRYDSRERLASIATAPDDGNGNGDPLLAFAYTYDAVSNVIAIADTRPEDAPAFGDPRRNAQRYRYDSRERLIEAAYYYTAAPDEGEPDGTIAYRFDPVGNMLEQRSAIEEENRGFPVADLGILSYGGDGGPEGRDGRAPGDPPGPQAMTRAATDDAERIYEYDDMGNMISGDGFEMAWDFADRLVRIEDDTMRAVYWYDHSGSRVAKRVWEKDADGGLPDAPTSVVRYVSGDFEIREYGQVTKYVREDTGRIAKITGSLDESAQRTQRFRASAGWNLFSLAVDAPDAVAQFLDCDDCEVDGLFRYDPADDSYTELAAEDELPAGSYFWVHSGNFFHGRVTGAFSEPEGGPISVDDGFFALAGFQALALGDLLPEVTESAWLWSGPVGQWQARFGGDLDFLSDAPAFLTPGQPVFVRTAGPGDLEVPPPSARVQYYHKDHLDSSSVIADGAGNVVEEIAYYPYGEPRHVYRASEHALPNPYQFAGKERDRETSLSYFEARYLAPTLGRFLSADPLAETFPEDYLSDPQMQHAYAFARSNPLAYSDPTGMIIETKRAQKKLKNLNPFGKTQLRRDNLTKAEKISKVFGGLNREKGDKAFSGNSGINVPKVSKNLRDKLDTDSDKFIGQGKSKIAQMAEDMKNTLPSSGKNKVDVDQFLKLFTKEAEPGNLGPDTQLTKGGLEILDGEATKKSLNFKAFDKFMDKLGDDFDLDEKFKELKGVADKALEKQSFKVDADKTSAFIDRFLGGTDKLGEDSNDDDE